MSATAYSVALTGLEGHIVEVEAVLGNGTPRTVLVGLPDTALYESRDRVRAAFEGAGLEWPSRLLTINLSPAGLPKHGTHYDLAIAAVVLVCQDKASEQQVRRFCFLGKLGLDGSVRSVRGILPALLGAVRAGHSRVIVPASQAQEASLVPDLTVWPVRHLGDVISALGGAAPLDVDLAAPVAEDAERPPDLADVHGHQTGKWALEVAAAGRHHLFLHGAPGVGKTMLASRLTSILPDLSAEEAIEVSALHSLAGRHISGRLLTRPPYSDPHHNVTMASLVGGGTPEVRPGAISLAHRGVLFLDEAPEFGSRLLDALRTPLEGGWVTIGRVNQQVRFPARFLLVMAANPCPCGNYGVAGRECRCAPIKVRQYQERLSGPILDRLDIQHHMLPLNRAFVTEAGSAEASATVLERVLAARDRQRHRLRDTPWLTNGEVPGSHLRKHLPLPADVAFLERAVARGQLSARGVDKVLRLAWTLTDLAGRPSIDTSSLRVAMQLRQGQLTEAAA